MQHLRVLLQVFLSQQQNRVLLLEDLAPILLFVDLLVELVDLLLVHRLLLDDLLLESVVLPVPLCLLLFLLRSEPAELVGELFVLALDPFNPSPQVTLLLLAVGHFALEVLDDVMVLLPELCLQLLLLGLKLVLQALFILPLLLSEDLDVSFQRHDLLLVLAHLAGQLVFEVIDEGLPAVQLALALLVVDSQVLVLDLDLVEQALDLADVVRVVLLCERLSESIDFLLEPLVLHLKVPELGSFQGCRSLSCARLVLHSWRLGCAGLLVVGRVRDSTSSSALADDALRARRVHSSTHLLEVLQAILQALALSILVSY